MLGRRSPPLFLAAALLLQCGSAAQSEPRTAGRAVQPAGSASAPPGKPRLAAAAPTGSSLPEMLPPPSPAVPAEISEPVPLSIEHVAPTGRWIAACVARRDSDGSGGIAVRVAPSGALEGDELEPVVAVGGAPLRAIDDLLGFDPLGRYLVVRDGSNALLIDIESPNETNLTALGFDDRDDAVPRDHHRSLAFDPRGELLAYLRRSGTASELVLRTLATGAERVVQNLTGHPYRLRWDGAGETLVAYTLVHDTSGNGKLEWPAPAASGRRLACSSPLPKLDVFPARGDRPTPFAVSRRGDEVREFPGLVAPFGSGALIRSGDGTLSLTASGIVKRLAPPECGARVLHADPWRHLVLVACAGGKNPLKAKVELLGAGYRQELGVEVLPTSVDFWPAQAERVLALYPGSEVLLLDLEERRVRRLDEGDQVLATVGPRALVRRAGKLHVFDVESGAIRGLGLASPRFSPVLRNGPMVAVGPLVIDLEKGRLLGRAPARPLALSATGATLIAEGGTPSAEALALGPARFHPASPQPP